MLVVVSGTPIERFSPIAISSLNTVHTLYVCTMLLSLNIVCSHSQIIPNTVLFGITGNLQVHFDKLVMRGIKTITDSSLWFDVLISKLAICNTCPCSHQWEVHRGHFKG